MDGEIMPAGSNRKKQERRVNRSGKEKKEGTDKLTSRNECTASEQLLRLGRKLCQHKTPQQVREQVAIGGTYPLSTKVVQVVRKRMRWRYREVRTMEDRNKDGSVESGLKK